LARSKEEKYQEWLERLEIPIEDTTRIDELQEALEEAIGYTPSESQVRALWDTVVSRYEEQAPAGARPIVYHFWWGEQIRWAIKGAPGAWSYERMLEIVRQRRGS